MTDFEAEGLLDDVEGEERARRQTLLTTLHADGIPLEELRRAVGEGRLALLPVERIYAARGARYSANDLTRLTGLPEERLRRQRRAMGLAVTDPDEPVYTDEDLDAAKRMREAVDAGLPEEQMLEIARVAGRAMATLADALRTATAEAFGRDTPSDLERGVRYAEVARNLGPLVSPLLEYALNAHMRDQLRSEVIAAAPSAGTHVAVSFADLVGFTRLGETLPPDELVGVGERLSEMAGEVAEGPVRLIKLIGDAAMLVSRDTDRLLDATLLLVDAAEREGADFPRLRAGVAHGRAVGRMGDWYGRPVNIAARVTAIARPGSVLATNEVQDAAAGDYAWSRAGVRSLKGIEGPVGLVRVRRTETPASSPD